MNDAIEEGVSVDHVDENQEDALGNNAEEDEEYEVEAILGKRLRGRAKTLVEYQVKWKGYIQKSDITWYTRNRSRAIYPHVMIAAGSLWPI